MATDHTPKPAVLATRLASSAAIVAVVVGSMVLAGWRCCCPSSSRSWRALNIFSMGNWMKTI